MQPGEPHPALVLALSRLLRPLIKVLIAQGFAFPALSRLLKEVYVDVAEREFEIDGKPQTDSRLNLLTGIHRKDIKALRQSGPDREAAPPALSRNAHLIARWTGVADYLDERGNPKPLPRNTTGDGASFEDLVASVSTDIRSRAVLDEWQRQDLVTIDGEGLVHLNAAAFVPKEDFADLAFYFGRNLRDHIAASGHNLLDGDPPMLEQAVYHEKLSLDSIAELAELSRRLGRDGLHTVNKKAFELSERDAKAGGGGHRVTFGVYFFSAPDKDADEAEG